MGKPHSPRHGSMQFWPRKRAKREYPRIKSWPKVDSPILLGFAGYKAGMTHLKIRDTSNSPNKGQLISIPATVIECPPLKPFSLRFYKKNRYNLQLLTEIPAKNFNKELKRKLRLPKKPSEKKIPEDYNVISLIVYTQPKLVSALPKKKPEIFEIVIGGKDNLEYAKSLLEKEIKISDILQPGKLVDMHAVTKAHGFQGAVRRFGIALRQKKSEKSVRTPGSLGPWKQQGHVMYRVAHAGQTGYHTRTEYNKLILKISDKPEEINPKGGFQNYGVVKNDYILVSGSIPGVRKRLIRFIPSIRPKTKLQIIPEIISIAK